MLIPRGTPTGAVAITLHAEAYEVVMAAAGARMPVETAGVLLGRSEMDNGRFDLEVTAAVPVADPGFVSPRGASPTYPAESEIQLSDLAERSGEVIGLFVADPGLGAFARRLDLRDLQRRLAPGSDLLLLVNPAVNEAAFYVWQAEHWMPTGGFYTVAPDASEPPSIPWNGSVAGAAAWFGAEGGATGGTAPLPVVQAEAGRADESAREWGGAAQWIPAAVTSEATDAADARALPGGRRWPLPALAAAGLVALLFLAAWAVGVLGASRPEAEAGSPTPEIPSVHGNATRPPPAGALANVAASPTPISIAVAAPPTDTPAVPIIVAPSPDPTSTLAPPSLPALRASTLQPAPTSPLTLSPPPSPSTLQAAPTARPTLSPPPFPPSPLQGSLAVGSRARVAGAGIYQLNVHRDPDLLSPIVTVLHAGQVVAIVGGPHLGSSPPWWQIAAGNRSGWVSAHYLEPVSP